MADEELHPLDAIFAAAGEIGTEISDGRAGVRMFVERAVLETPLELGVDVDPDGRVTLTGSPPTQRVEASWFPVLHRIRLVVGS